MTGRTSRGIPDQLCFRNSSVWTKHSAKLIQNDKYFSSTTAVLFHSYRGEHHTAIWMRNYNVKIKLQEQKAGIKVYIDQPAVKTCIKSLFIWGDRNHALNQQSSAFTGPVTLTYSSINTINKQLFLISKHTQSFHNHATLNYGNSNKTASHNCTLILK